jgi:iron complex outermembrane receptor protein
LIDLEYKPIDDILLYAKYARGYRQGGIAPNNIALEVWGPEKVESYEVGAKTKFATEGVRGYLNFAAFYNDFSDQQITANLLPKANSGFGGGAAIINAGKSVIKGIELDGSVTLLDQFKVDAGYTYLHTEVKSITQFERAEPQRVVGQCRRRARRSVLLHDQCDERVHPHRRGRPVADRWL